MWRKMGQADIPALVAISDAVHGRYSEHAHIYAERLTLYPAGCFIHEQGGEVTGYLISHPWRKLSPVPFNRLVGLLPEDSDSFYLHDMALLPEARGTGAGTAGVGLVVECAVAANLDEISLVAVNGADSFWERCGFDRIDAPVLASSLASYGSGVYYMVRSLAGEVTTHRA